MPVERSGDGKFKRKRRDKRREYHYNRGAHPCQLRIGVMRRTYALHRRTLLLHKLLFPTVNTDRRTKLPAETCLSHALAMYCRWLKKKLDAKGIDWQAALDADARHKDADPVETTKRFESLTHRMKLVANNIDDRRPR